VRKAGGGVMGGAGMNMCSSTGELAAVLGAVMHSRILRPPGFN